MYESIFEGKKSRVRDICRNTHLHEVDGFTNIPSKDHLYIKWNSNTIDKTDSLLSGLKIGPS